MYNEKSSSISILPKQIQSLNKGEKLTNLILHFILHINNQHLKVAMIKII